MAASPDTRSTRRLPVIGLYRRSVSIFLGALVLFLVAMPLTQYLADAGLLEGPLLAIVLIAGVLAVGGRRRSLLLAASLAVPALAARGLWHYWPDPYLHGLFLVLGALLLIQVTVHLLHFIVRAPLVDAEVLAAGIATYLVLGIMWGIFYLLVGFLEPNAFSVPAAEGARKGIEGYDALYFSFVTLTTIGYGDITPVAPFARMLAIAEATIGTLYLAVLIARLVTLYTERRS